MANALLAAFAQPTLDLQAPVARRRRHHAARTITHTATAESTRPYCIAGTDGNGSSPNAAVTLARAVASSFGDIGAIEALEVGREALPRLGVRPGDALLVDWSSQSRGASGSVLRLRAVRGEEAAQRLAWTEAGDEREGDGVVFAVIRQVEDRRVS